jgi:RNA polymerase sigma factor (sigma-70 family)
MNEDEQLLRQYVRDHSEAAFRELVARHIDLVYSVAVRQVGGDRGLAQDVVQVVFFDLSRKAQGLSFPVVLAGWLCRHTFFVASSLVRAERRRRRREQLAVQMNVPNDSPGPDWERLRPYLDEVWQGLSASERDAIVLRYFQGRDLKSVGATLGLSEDAAQKRVARAMAKMRASLARRGVTLATASLALMITTHSVCAAPPGLATQVASSVLAGTGTGSGVALTWIKTMAWLKTKTVVVTTAVALLSGIAITYMAHNDIWRLPVFGEGGNSSLSLLAKASPSAIEASQSRFGFHWSQVESSDYRQYIVNLRAIGCPESMIRDIITADVSQQYAQKIRAIWDGQYAYWKKIRGATPGQWKMIEPLLKEKRDVIKELVGCSISEEALNDISTPRLSDTETQLLFLPEEKRNAAARWLAESGLEEKLANANRAGFSSEREFFDAKVKLLAQALSPEELEEYRLRNSSKADWLRGEVRYFDITPEEFKALFALREQHLGPDGLTESVSRATAIEEIRTLFGDASAKEYERVSDYGYANARGSAESAGFSSDLADAAGQVGYEARLAVAEIAADKTLSASERQRRILWVRQEAAKLLNQSLGTQMTAGIRGTVFRTLEDTAQLTTQP